jgi:multidrug efflux pump subunit AcrA (membrane-fusion protein)
MARQHILSSGGKSTRTVLAALLVLAIGHSQGDWEWAAWLEADAFAQGHGNDHGHGEGDGKSAQVTVWGGRFEIFLEHPYLVAGKPASFVTHVTDLKKWVPRRDGPVEFVLQPETGEELQHLAEKPARDGIYIPDLTFPTPGVWTVSIRIPIDGSESVVQLPPMQVYSSDREVAEAPEQEEIEGISFLKETQWKFPFQTEVLKQTPEGLFVQESAVVELGGERTVFVHPAGETVQKREIVAAEVKNGFLEVRSGLSVGDRVVTRGADVIVVSLSSGEEGHDHGDAAHAHGSADDANDVNAVTLSSEMRSSLGLTTSAVEKGDMIVSLDVYGWIRPRKENITEVRAPIAGVVKEIFAREGTMLEVGAPIVTLQARETLEWQQTILTESNRRRQLAETRDLLSAEGRAEFAKLLGGLQVDSAEVNRISRELDLIEKAGIGSVPQREINKVRGAMESAVASLKAKEALAAAYGIPGEQIAAIKRGEEEVAGSAENLPPEFRRRLKELDFSLQESQSLEEVARAKLVALGFGKEGLDQLAQGKSQAINDTIAIRAENSFLVSDLHVKRQSSLNPGDLLLGGIDYNQVLVDAEIPEVDIGAVMNRAGDSIAVGIPALDDRVLEAEVLFFDTTIHAGDRKAHLVLALDNVEGFALREGMAVSVAVPIETRHDTLTVPKEAILTDGLEKLVFLAEDGRFHRQVVIPGMQGLRSVEILQGLDAGQSVAVSGAPALLLSLKSQQGNLTGGHGHAH